MSDKIMSHIMSN